MRPFLFLIAMFAAGSASPAATRVFVSRAEQVALVELFTSEGCSSCPPADRWFSALRNETGLWRDFVPVSFHVDYWNRLGWPDAFSTPANTHRQYRYQKASALSSVYTPCFMLNGQESKVRPALVPRSQLAGVITATYDGETLVAEFAPALRAAEAYDVHAAILGGSISSKVTAGENRGETLAHEFVALAQVSGEPGSRIVLARPQLKSVGRYALAIWITPRGEMTPVQATGGWID